MNVRPSRVLRKLRNNETVICTKVNLADARSAEIASLCGFDCLWLDMEHIPTDWESVESQIRCAKIYDVDVMVRVSKGSYSDYIQPLEADAAGIMVPHLMSLEEAKEVVRWTRFHPLGKRPLDGGNSDGKYCMVDIKDYIEQSNREKFVTVQIEDVEPLDELEEIAKVDGIDMLFFGPGDFSQSIGSPGNFEHPKIKDTKKRIAEVCRKHNKYAAIPGTVDNYSELVDMGYNFITIGADVVGLWKYNQEILSGVGKVQENDSKGLYKGK